MVLHLKRCGNDLICGLDGVPARFIFEKWCPEHRELYPFLVPVACILVDRFSYEKGIVALFSVGPLMVLRHRLAGVYNRNVDSGRHALILEARYVCGSD